jgi:hypothetical protein
MKRDYWLYLLIALLVLAAAIIAMCYSQRDDLQDQLAMAKAQNVQLTADVREAKARAYRAGVITCGNEDVAYLNDLADTYRTEFPELAELLEQMAMGWGYDDDTLNMMVEDYMNGDTQYE